MKPFTAVAVSLTTLALVGCTVGKTEVPPLTGPSELALSISVLAIPDSISQNGSDQSSIKVTAMGPDGKPMSAVPIRLEMMVNGVAQDYGKLDARSIVTNVNGVASTTYTAPPSPADGVFGICGSLPGTCVSIVATAIATNFETANPQQVQIRLVPPGVILPPASTPTAAFTFSPSTVTANLPVQFDASTSQVGTGATQIASYAWTFGDGTSGSGKTVSHTYLAGNTFNVTLTVTNDRGLSASTTRALAVGGAALPTPLFTFSPAAAAVNEPVFFNASTSTPGAGHSSITAYRWIFGDGKTDAGVTVSHQFATAGNYLVQLTVTDEAGQSATSAGTPVTIGSPPVPTADFKFSPEKPFVNQAVTFDASISKPAVGAGGQPIVSYTWAFGDGTAPQTTSSPIFSHTFGVSGDYSVILIVKDSAGRTSAPSTAQKVTVTGAVSCSDATLPCVLITATPSPATVNQEISFVAFINSPGAGASTIVNYQWDFGDGTQQFGANFAAVGYTYRTKGSFTVKVTVTNNIGRLASATFTILVQ